MDYVKVPSIYWEYTTPQVLFHTQNLRSLVVELVNSLCYECLLFFFPVHDVGSNNGVRPRNQNKPDTGTRPIRGGSSEVCSITTRLIYRNISCISQLVIIFSKVISFWHFFLMIVRLSRYAVESYLEQILSHGFFHADPVSPSRS